MKTIIRAKFKRAYIKAKAIRLLQEYNKIVLLNKDFYAILIYLILKIFQNYNRI